MTWHISDQGFDIALSSYVPQAIRSGIAHFLDKLLTKSQYNLSKNDFYAIHPGGVKILQACEESLNITPKDNRFSYDILRNYGNMSSATILFVLKKIMDDLNPVDNAKKIFSCAFGPGLTLESMLLKVSC
jgi:alpha-pyrone synthase